MSAGVTTPEAEATSADTQAGPAQTPADTQAEPQETPQNGEDREQQSQTDQAATTEGQEKEVDFEKRFKDLQAYNKKIEMRNAELRRQAERLENKTSEKDETRKSEDGTLDITAQEFVNGLGSDDEDTQNLALQKLYKSIEKKVRGDVLNEISPEIEKQQKLSNMESRYQQVNDVLYQMDNTGKTSQAASDTLALYRNQGFEPPPEFMALEAIYGPPQQIMERCQLCDMLIQEREGKSQQTQTTNQRTLGIPGGGNNHAPQDQNKGLPNQQQGFGPMLKHMKIRPTARY